MFGRKHADNDELELTETVSLLRYAYGIQATVGLIYVPLVLDGKFIDVDKPTVTFGLFTGLDPSRVHACEFDVIRVPEGYLVDRSVDGRMRLYDENDLPCTVSCDEMCSQAFTVSSGTRTFEAPIVKEFCQVASSRDKNGRAYNDHIGLWRKPGGVGWQLTSPRYPKPSPAVQAARAERAALAEREGGRDGRGISR